jgi:hypothetical protein
LDNSRLLKALIMMTHLNENEREALRVIAKRSPLFQPNFPISIVERLLALHLVQQTLGGTLKATNKGLVAAYADC